MPRSRHTRTMSTETIEHGEREPGEGPLRRQVRARTATGRAISVDCGSGSPEQIVLWTSGTVQHDVASTDVCMNRAKPSVLTARYRPRMRRAVSPTSTDTTAVADAGEGQQQDERDTARPRWAAMSAPTATNPNWPSETWPDPPGEDGQRQGDDAVDADLRHEERPTDVEHQRQERGHDDGDDHARSCPPSCAGRSLGRAGRRRSPWSTTTAPRCARPSAARRPARAGPPAATRRG